MSDPELRKRIDFERDAPRDGTVVRLVMMIDGSVEDMAEAEFVGGSWRFAGIADEHQWTRADFHWNSWFVPEESERA